MGGAGGSGNTLVQPPDQPQFDLSGMTPAPPASPAWPPAARWAAGCGTGCALLVLLEGLVIWAFTAAALGSRQQLVGQVQAPRRVARGMPFPLKLTVRNPSKEPATLTSVVARAALTDRITLTAPQPAPATEPITIWGATTWQYQRSLKPGDRFTVTFQAIPAETGTVSGALEVQSGFLPVTVPFTVEVVESDDPAGKPEDVNER